MTSRRPSLSLVVSLLALVIASAGAGYAAGTLPAHSVGTAQLKPHAVTLGKIAPAAVKPLRGHRGAMGPRGLRGLTGQTGPAGRSALTPLKTGETITGSWAMSDKTTGFELDAETLAIPAPSAIDGAHVVFASNTDERQVGDGCDGDAGAPVAGPGFVCVYLMSGTGFADPLGTSGDADYSTSGYATRVGDGTTTGFGLNLTGTNAVGFFANGTWAYTAP